MPRMRFARTKVSELIALRYGQGHLQEYKPFLRLGRGWFIPHSTHSWTFNPILLRHHDIFSRGEKDALVFAMWIGAVDAREQMPAWHCPHAHPLEDGPFPRRHPLPSSAGTIELAHDARIRHPVYPGTRDYLVLTLDLLATMPTLGGHGLIAIPTKGKAVPGEDASQYRQLELLELQRRYALEVGAIFAPWIRLPEFSQLLTNLRLAFTYAALSERLHEQHYQEFLAIARGKLDEMPIRLILKTAAQQLRLPIDDVGPLWEHALWRQDLLVDLRQPLVTSYVAPKWSASECSALKRALLKGEGCHSF